MVPVRELWEKKAGKFYIMNKLRTEQYIDLAVASDLLAVWVASKATFLF